MVEVGNKLIGQFADCVAEQLTGHDVGGAELVEVDGSSVSAGPDGKLSDLEGLIPSRSGPAAQGATAGTDGARAGAAEHVGIGAQRTPQVRSAPPVDLLETAGAPVLKRVVPVILLVVGLILLRKVLRKKPAGGVEE